MLKQKIRIANFKSIYQKYPILLLPSILGPVLFNLFINDLFFFIKEAELENFAEDSTIYVGSKDLTEFLEILRKECETAINWLKTNNMIENPYKLMITSSKKDLSKSVLNRNGVELTIESFFKLLGVETENKMDF